jgi:acyltransferase
MLRALAVAEMIHGHSLDGLLDAGLRGSAFFVNWTYVRGYTAPVFLFAAGFAFAVATLPRIDDYTRFSRYLLRRIKRLSFVILLGYLMYLPFFSLRKTILSIGTPGWENLLKVDILRCIGVSALCLQLWFLLKPKKEVTWAIIGILTLALPLLTPYVSSSEWVAGLPAFIRYYLVNSRFPLFYYSSFLFLGFLLGYVFSEKKHHWLPYVLVIAVVMLVSAQVLSRLGVVVSLHRFMTKGGVIIVLTLILERCEGLWRRMPNPVKYFGQESLIVYVVHLMIVYGSVLNRGLTSYWGKTLAYGEVYLFIAWLAAAMVLLAYVWHRLKVEHIQVANWVKNTIYWSFLILFLLKPN